MHLILNYSLLFTLLLCFAEGSPRLLHEQIEPRGRPSFAILDDLRAQQACVTTPAEFVEAFTKRQPRCVDPDLIARATSSYPGAIAFALNVTVKPTYFWSGNQALEKYLRVGYPQKIGDYTVNSRQNYSSFNFLGVEDVSNGQAFLQTLGWPGEFIDITSVFSLNIYSKKAMKIAIRAQNKGKYPFAVNTDPLMPTWDAVRHFLIYTFADIGLDVPTNAMNVLKTTPFKRLTGCPSQCAYTIDSFPSADARTPITIRPRGTDKKCPVVDGATSMPPSAIDMESSFCSQTWIDKYAAMKSSIGDGCTPLNALASAQFLKQQITSTFDAIEQALWIRAYLAQNCNGGYNSLFSGDGWTYTGQGGLLAGLSSEYIASPFDVSSVDAKGRASISFCVNGLNGGRVDADGKCPLPPPSET